METTKINMGEQPQAKKETERINTNTGSVDYSESVDNNRNETVIDETNMDGKGKKIRTAAAAGIGGAALGGGVAMAANSTDETVEDEPEPTPEPKPASKSEPKNEPKKEPEPEPAPEPVPAPTPEQATGTEQASNTEQNPGPEPASSPHIEEVLVDPNDIDGEHIMNIVGTGTTEIEGVEFNTAMVTDQAGNTYFMVDVDGEVNDPNATYDIIVDAETGEMVGLPFNLSQSDANLMADNGMYYVEPSGEDSNNIAQADMKQDVFDPSGEDVTMAEPTYTPEPEFEVLAENPIEPSIDIIEPIM